MSTSLRIKALIFDRFPGIFNTSVREPSSVRLFLGHIWIGTLHGQQPTHVLPGQTRSPHSHHHWRHHRAHSKVDLSEVQTPKYRFHSLKNSRCLVMLTCCRRNAFWIFFWLSNNCFILFSRRSWPTIKRLNCWWLRLSIPFRKPSKETSIEIDDALSSISPLDVVMLWSRLCDWVKVSVGFFRFLVGDWWLFFLWSLMDADPASSSLFSMSSNLGASNGFCWQTDGSKWVGRENNLTKESHKNQSNRQRSL